MNETTVRPTKKQRELLTFISEFIAQHGFSPSYREIMAGLDYTSVATVSAHVSNLITRGHLRKRDHSARSLEVVGHVAPSIELDLPTRLNNLFVAETAPAEVKQVQAALILLGYDELAARCQDWLENHGK